MDDPGWLGLDLCELLGTGDIQAGFKGVNRWLGPFKKVLKRLKGVKGVIVLEVSCRFLCFKGFSLSRQGPQKREKIIRLLWT